MPNGPGFKLKFFSLLAACFALSSLPAAQAQTVIDRKDFDRINVTPVLEYLEDSGRMQGVAGHRSNHRGMEKMDRTIT